MKTVYIIVIAVGCSVGATLGVLVGIQMYAQAEYEKFLEENRLAMQEAIDKLPYGDYDEETKLFELPTSFEEAKRRAEEFGKSIENDTELYEEYEKRKAEFDKVVEDYLNPKIFNPP